MRISAVVSTRCFVRHGEGLAQVVRVVVVGAPVAAFARATLSGPGLAFAGAWQGRLDPTLAGQEGGPAWAPAEDPGLRGPARFTGQSPLPEGPVVEIPVVFTGEAKPGDKVWVRATVEVEGSVSQAEAELTVHEPGWRMFMVPHFHYDPVWWNTQAGYTSGWDELLWALERRDTFQHSGLALVEAHLERARLDPRYKFVLAEVDYLKPFWDLYPDRREEVRALIAAGRLEVVGGTYNEPNTNLTGVETAIRSAVYGLGFQRDVMGADPQSAWQLDVFGHDPAFPGIMAAAGLTSSAWARGPFHQWGPRRELGTNTWMQFPSEFEWVAPNGLGLLTSYMPNHYSAGWELERATTLEGAMWQAYEIFCDLAEVSAVKATLLPVGTDYTPPSRLVADVAEGWGRRYEWPRFSVALVREFFEQVREELEGSGRRPSPQSRDMNPIYTGKDVSFIDTKQAQRRAEAQLAEAEAMAAISSLLGGPLPWRALDKAWRQLEFNAHHDGITGSESDQVYLDLLAGWREAYELARAADEVGRSMLVGAIDTRGEGEPLVVTNTLGFDRSGVVTAELPAGEAVDVVSSSGEVLAALGQPGPRPGTRTLSFVAPSVPGVGYKTFWLRPRREAVAGWSEAPGTAIENEWLEAEAGDDHGGGLVRIVEKQSGFNLVPEGEVAGELFVYPEYPAHPRFGEGPWNLLPSGPPSRSGTAPARVRKQICPLAERLVVEGEMPGEGFSYRHIWTLWQGTRRLELVSEVHGWAADDRLLRLRFPTVLAGATAVSAVGASVVGRGFGLIDVDVAEAPWTLDNPAAEWFGLSVGLAVEVCEALGSPAYHERAVGVAEVVVPAGDGGAPWARELVLALLQKGVTATCSEAGANRYGALKGDSNLPDFRIGVGRPSENAFVAEVLAAAGASYSEELEAQLARDGSALVFVPAARPLSEVWAPNADLRGVRDLPVLLVASAEPKGPGAAVPRLVGEVCRGRVRVVQRRSSVPCPERVPAWTAAVLNRGTPSFAVDISGAMYVSVLRACTGWPSGVWIDPPRRSAPDGSAFELEHWSHVFEHALVFGRGDWREAGIVEEAQAYNRPLVASATQAHGGRLPREGRLFGISRARGEGAEGRPGQLVLSALKPAGNPYAAGGPPATGSADGVGAGGPEVTLRVYEATGHPVEAEVTSAFELERARTANLVEVPTGEVALQGTSNAKAFKVRLGPCDISTLRLQFAPSTPSPAASPAEVPECEVERAQPVFSRYWLHNRGAAPLGNQSLAVHLLTTSVALRAGEEFQVVAQVASGAARSHQEGRLELAVPEGWQADPPGRLFSLAPGAFLQVPVRVVVPGAVRPGRRFLSARVSDGAGQVQQDVLTVDVLPALAEGHKEAGAGPLSLPAPFGHPGGQWAQEVELSAGPAELTVVPGGTARAWLRLTNRTMGEIQGEAQFLSPVETWPLAQPWEQGFSLAAGETLTLEATVGAPEAGWLESWAIWKVTYFGRIWYSPAVALKLGPRALPRERAAQGELEAMASASSYGA